MDRAQALQPTLTSQTAAALIIEKWKRAQQLRDETLASASEACRAALDCGDLLLQQKASHKGNFELWLKRFCPQIEDSTATSFMRISRLRKAVGVGEINSQMVWQFYHALDLLPPRTPSQSNSTGQILQFWSFATKLQTWLPQLPDNQKSRFKDWWETVGRGQGWI